MPYLTLYVLLGLCLAALAFVGHRMWQERAAEQRHSGSPRRGRKWFHKSHNHDH